MHKRVVLKNGLRIVSAYQKESQAAIIFILVKTGSKYETKDISGISHFLEHMFFKGTEKMKKPNDVPEMLDMVGGSYNAFTSEECTGYYAKVDHSHFDLAIDWVADIFLNSKLPAKEMEKERGVIIEEINMHYNNPMSHIDQVWKEVLYGDQPAGWNIAGTKETVSKITRKQLVSYHNERYSPENTVVCIAGRYDEEAVMNKIRKIFSPMKSRDTIERNKVIEVQKVPQVNICYRKINQVNFALGVRSYSLTDKRKYIVNVMSAFLGGMMSSRLYQKVVEKMGAAYYIASSNDSNVDTGNFAVWSGVDEGKFLDVIETILKEFRRLKKEKVGPEELRKAKDYIKGKMVLGLEDAESKASFYGTQELLTDRMLSLKDILARIESVTAEDILGVANDIFCPEKLNLAIIGPFKNKKEFEKVLKI